MLFTTGFSFPFFETTSFKCYYTAFLWLENIEQYFIFFPKQYNQSESFFDFKILTDYQSFTCVNSVLSIWKVKIFC